MSLTRRTLLARWGQACARGAAAVAAMAGVAGTAGCGRERKVVIGVVPKSIDNIFWQAVHAGAIAAARDLDVSIEWNGPPKEQDFARQLQIVDTMVSRRLSGIAVAAADRTALVQTLERAARENVPVVVFDSGVNTETYVSYVATDNYAAGRMAGEALATLTGPRGKVAVVGNGPGSYSTLDRERGFRDVLKEKYPGLEIVAEQFGYAERARARAAAENILTANPKLDGMFSSTEPTAIGAILAAKSRELGGKLKFVAFDSSDALIEELRAGTIQATVVQDPFRMGYQAVRTVVDSIRGEKPPKKQDLPARVVRTADLEDPEVKELLFPDLSRYLAK